MKTKAGMSLSLLLTWLPVFSKDVPGEQKQNQKMLRNELNQMRNVQRVYTNIVFKRHPNSVIMWILKSHDTPGKIRLFKQCLSVTWFLGSFQYTPIP